MELPDQPYEKPSDEILEISSDPCEGDYEHPELGHCVALVIFNGPNSVGVLYPDYFWDMPLTAIAFCLTMWQFCIKEWANSWHQNVDLGMAAMLDKYESQHAGLKELHEVAPRCMNWLQNEWKDYTIGFLGVVFVPGEGNVASMQNSRMCPNTPEPDQCCISMACAQT
ncbi:unnamed protein product [Rhizoctonia solani]|uniref:DUF6532 domain-containing protein n=1 Tax=Rhizoctonia solani TaxID=456999 RepID=A0A8H2XE69_9AGAM|nr:unnamed protein product [Rhizoctonia solani]